MRINFHGSCSGNLNVWITSSRCRSTANKKQPCDQQEYWYTWAFRKARNKTTAIPSITFFVLGFGCCKSKDLTKFYGWRYFSHGKKLGKTGWLSAKFYKLPEIPHIQQENFPLAFLIISEAKVPRRNQSVTAKCTRV